MAENREVLDKPHSRPKLDGQLVNDKHKKAAAAYIP
jgi:hypothetical protein